MAKLHPIISRFYLITYCACQIPIGIPGGQRTTHCNLTLDATEDFVTIYKLLVTFLASFDDLSNASSDAVCAKTKETLNDVFAKTRRDWEPCLKPDWEYYGAFVDESLHNFVDFFCDDDGANGRKYTKKQSKNCRETVEFSRLEECLKPVYYQNEFNIPGQMNQLCRGIGNVKGCTLHLIKEQCPSSEEYQNLVESLLNKIDDACDFPSSAKYIGSVLAIVSMLIILALRFLPVRKWWEDANQRIRSTPLNNQC